MAKARFLHVGLTVKDMKRTIRFYQKYFGFELEMEGVFDQEFIGSHSSLYRVKEGSYSDFCFLRSENGIVLEVFQFHPQKEMLPIHWERPGYTHICFKVDDVLEVYKQMKADGIPFFFSPKLRGTPEEHWVFFEDPDGNLIEIQD